MTVDELPAAVMRLRLCILSEADPGALMRVIERFQNLGVVPRRVNAEAGDDETIRISVETAGLGEAQLSLIAARIAQVPCILSVELCRL